MRHCVGMGQLFTTQSLLLTTLKKKAFLRKLGEGEKLLVTSIFSFSDRFFFSIIERSPHFSNICRLYMCSIWSHPKFCKLFKCAFMDMNRPLFGRWMCGKPTSSMELVISQVLVKEIPGKHGAMTQYCV